MCEYELAALAVTVVVVIFILSSSSSSRCHNNQFRPISLHSYFATIFQIQPVSTESKPAVPNFITYTTSLVPSQGQADAIYFDSSHSFDLAVSTAASQTQQISTTSCLFIGFHSHLTSRILHVHYHETLFNSFLGAPGVPEYQIHGKLLSNTFINDLCSAVTT
jgi:hypothetical protein